MKLSDRIRRWRESRDPRVSKAELARRVGVSPEAVLQWEQGKTQPTHDNIELIAEALELTLAGFWGDPPPVRKRAA